ncbi:hypothetical protein LZ198_05660 [Myxococcus sp. K15C18031901]|uniref:hypothetical protein n=1 Tax=Myxococcus dinghuensis TaxID=2906761 RepID=UPI0020A7CE7F|nr:hypothetical protein [Myxococcus dinghuensis]MCP3098365.1 hypothetical protein [Myxococcus dinghuensis]
MKTSRLFALGLLASTTALAAPKSALRLQTSNNDVSVQVTDQSLSGSDMQLKLANDTLRGQAFGRPVDLTLKNDTVRGQYGGKPVDLKVTDREEILEAEGTFGGQLTSFQVGPQQVTGTVGLCNYQLLITRHDRYEGWRTCGEKLDRSVSLYVPARLADENDELAAALSLLLAQ